MNIPGYAINKNLSFWRVVDGSVPDPEHPEKVYMDPDTEYFMSFEDGPPPAPLPSNEELVSIAQAECDRLLAIAAIRIAPLQDEADLDDATPAGLALLKKWKQYRVAVNRVPAQPDYPHGITWPLEPS